MLARAERKPQTAPVRAAQAVPPAPARSATPATNAPMRRDSGDALDPILARAVAGRAQRATLQRYVVKPALSVKGTQFEAQVRQGNGSFRNNAGTVVVQAGPNNTPLRVSEDGKMAIEDTDLGARQAKVFYATSSVMKAANKKLVHHNSEFELYTAAKNAIKVDNQAGKSLKLNKIMARRRFRPAALGKATKLNSKKRTADDAGLSLTVKGVCGDVASAIVGKNVTTVEPKLKQALALTGPTHMPEYNIARAFVHLVTGLAHAQTHYNDAIDPGDQNARDVITQAYMNLLLNHPQVAAQIATALGINEAAEPEVGQAYGALTLGTQPGAGTPDYAQAGNPLRNPTADAPNTHSGKARDIWGSHFGAVVAASLGNRVTLENYARLHEEGTGGVLQQPIYYFQMYGPASQPAQTWHTYWTTGANPVINPMTMVLG